MPLRSNLLTTRRSTFDLPILPFLAPRVFQPWPSRGRSAHSGTAAVQTLPSIDGKGHDYWPENVPSKSERLGGPTLHRVTVRKGRRPNLSLPNERRLEEYPHAVESADSSGGFSNIYSADGQIQGSEGGKESYAGLSEEEEFERRFVEVWGGSKQKQRTPEKDTSLPKRIVDMRPGLRPFKIRRVIFSDVRMEKLQPFKMKRGVFRWRAKNGKAKRSPSLELKTGSIHSEMREGNEGISPSSKLRVRRFLSHGRGILSPGLKLAMYRHRRDKTYERRRRIHLHNQHQVRLLKIPGVRPKMVRWNFARDPNMRFPSRVWHRLFSMLNLRHENFMRGQKMPKLIALSREMLVVESKDDLVSTSDLASIGKFWDTVPKAKRLHLWPQVMLAALRHHPENALGVLSAIYTEPYPPSYAISDSLDFIISHYLRNRENSMTGMAQTLWIEIDALLHNGPPDHVHLSQSSLYLLISHLDLPHIRSLYKSLDELHHPLHLNTLIHLGSRLAKLGDKGFALEILKRINQFDFDFNTPKMLSLCTSILNREDRVLQAGNSDSEVFGFLLQCGIKPNIIIYNVLLSNSLKAGDHETGWKIHDMMTENGIEPDSYTYSILLNDAKWRMDPRAIRRVINLVTEKGIRSSHIITDVLHAIFLQHQQQYWVFDPFPISKDQPPKIFEKMLQVYCDFFHFKPLSRLIPNLTENYPSFNPLDTATLVKEQLMDPPVPTLVIMLTGFLNGLTQSQASLEFYHNFRNLVLAEDAVAAELTKTTHIYNLVLMSFGRFPERLVDCPNVIADMLSPNMTSKSTLDNSPTFHATDSEGDAQSTYDKMSKVTHGASLSGTSNGEAERATEWPDADRSSSESLPSFDTSIPSLPAQEDSRATPTAEQNQVTKPGIILYDHMVTSRPLIKSEASVQFPSNDQTSTPSQHAPKPDVYTWSILLKIFMDQRQPRAAEKVLKMMQERGVTPNQVTWNSLALGYMRMQDSAMTVDAIERLEQAGLQLDHYTKQGLGWIRDRRALIELMKIKDGKSRAKRSAGEGIFLSRLKKALNGEPLNPKRDGRIDNSEGGDEKHHAGVAGASTF